MKRSFIIMCLICFACMSNKSKEQTTMQKPKCLKTIPQNYNYEFQVESLMNYFEYIYIEIDAANIDVFLTQNEILPETFTTHKTINFDAYFNKFSWYLTNSLESISYGEQKGISENWKWECHILMGNLLKEKSRKGIYILYFEER